MDYGTYQNPPRKRRGVKGKKVACVITTHFSHAMRTVYPFIGEDMGQPEQYFDDKLDNFQFTMACYKHYDAGVPYDLILIDNSTQDHRADFFMRGLGVPIHRRENNGFSFGGYKYAWELLGDKYDYYLFHEQDHVPCKDGWLRELLEAYLADDEIGALGNVVEYRENDENVQNLKDQFAVIAPNRKFMYNLDGAFCFTSSDVLSEITLRVLDGTIASSTNNEILFVQPILEAGYKIASLGCRDFHNTETIHFYGMRKGKLVRPFDQKKLAPIVEATTRKLCPQMRDYFSWYEA